VKYLSSCKYQLFLTKNGHIMKKDLFIDTNFPLIPMIAIDLSVPIKINWGAEPFAFDLKRHIDYDNIISPRNTFLKYELIDSYQIKPKNKNKLIFSNIKKYFTGIKKKYIIIDDEEEAIEDDSKPKLSTKTILSKLIASEMKTLINLENKYLQEEQKELQKQEELQEQEEYQDQDYQEQEQQQQELNELNQESQEFIPYEESPTVEVPEIPIQNQMHNPIQNPMQLPTHNQLHLPTFTPLITGLQPIYQANYYYQIYYSLLFPNQYTHNPFLSQLQVPFSQVPLQQVQFPQVQFQQAPYQMPSLVTDPSFNNIFNPNPNPNPNQNPN
jgi:hypothetical protein